MRLNSENILTDDLRYRPQKLARQRRKMRHPRRHFQPRRNRTYHSSRQMMLREATKSAALNKVLELLDNLLASKVTKAERPTYPDYFPLQFEPYFESGNTKFGDMPSIRRFADNYRPKDAEIFTGRRSAF